MSIEAIHWALNSAPIPADRRDASSLAIVLVGLANHADPEGNNAFPALSTLTRYTRLTERSVRYALRNLEDLDLIKPSDPDIVAAYVKRADRRPNGYNLNLFHTTVDNHHKPVDKPHPDRPNQGQTLPPADQHEGQTPQQRGADNTHTGGRACPRTVLEPSGNRPSRAPAPDRSPRHRDAHPAAAPTPPVCGHCDARPGDPIAARLIWTDPTSEAGRRCPRCHPAELALRPTTAPLDFAAGDR